MLQHEDRTPAGRVEDLTAHPPATRRLSTGKKLLFSSICLMVVVLFCEAGVRVRAWIRFGSGRSGFVDDAKVYDPALGIWVLRPGFAQSGSRISIRVNSLGFRGEEISREKPPGTIRIVCLGASTTFCAEVTSDEKAWPHRLQTLLRERYPNESIEVINAGVPGYVVDDSYKNLVGRILPFEPDVVIVYHAHNDIAHDTRRLAVNQGIVQQDTAQGPSALRVLSRVSLLIDLGYKNLRARPTASAEKLKAIPDDLPERFVQTLKQIHDVTAEHNIALVLSTFTARLRRNQDPQTQAANASCAFYYMPWMTTDGLLETMELYNRAIVRLATSHSIAVVEETASIPGDGAHYVDSIHLTDIGCERMARRFATFVVEKRIIDSIVSGRQHGRLGGRGIVGTRLTRNGMLHLIGE